MDPWNCRFLPREAMYKLISKNPILLCAYDSVSITRAQGINKTKSRKFILNPGPYDISAGDLPNIRLTSFLICL